MLSVPTLWVVFTVNFVALGLVWTHVARSYPKFDAARFWAVSAYIAAAAAASSMLRGVVPNPIPLLGGSALLIFACCLAEMGIRRFFGAPASWLRTALIVGLSVTSLAYFLLVRDDMAMRIFIYSLAQVIPIVLTLKFVLAPHNWQKNPGARLAGIIAVMMVAVYAVRSVAAFLGIGGGLAVIEFNQFQAGLVLALVFLSMAWNFGFLLMAIDRLRNEVAVLALLDDLTGVANRRQLVAHLAQQCATAERTREPFALLVVDLDGFKEINDNFGHATGDECLRLFTRAAQSRLRPGDLLARSGGDEFCIVLAGMTGREGVMVARRVLESLREQSAMWKGVPGSLAASIGVAQWSSEFAADVGRLIAAADQALYAAKKDGKNRCAIYQPAAPPVEMVQPLRRRA